jgi:hypothetical protein
MPASKRTFKRVSDESDPTTEDVTTEAVEPEPEPTTNGTNAGLPAGDVPSGWSGAQRTVDESSTFAQSFRPDTQSTQIIRFLEAAPYASYRRHWVETAGKRRPYTCLQTVGKECPMCEIGDKVSPVTSFNVALLGDDGVPVVRSWDVAVRLYNTLKAYAVDPKVGPLNKPGLYFAIKQVQGDKRQGNTTNVTPVRERDLLEDWGVKPMTPAQEAAALARRYTPDVVEIPRASELREVADALLKADEAGTFSRD